MGRFVLWSPVVQLTLLVLYLGLFLPVEGLECIDAGFRVFLQK